MAIMLQPKESIQIVLGVAGALLSIGLMRKIPLSFMRDCLATAGVTTGEFSSGPLDVVLCQQSRQAAKLQIDQ